MATTQCIEKWNTDDADQADKLKYKELIFPGVTVNRQVTDLGSIHSVGLRDRQKCSQNGLHVCSTGAAKGKLIF